MRQVCERTKRPCNWRSGPLGCQPRGRYCAHWCFALGRETQSTTQSPPDKGWIGVCGLAPTPRQIHWSASRLAQARRSSVRRETTNRSKQWRSRWDSGCHIVFAKRGLGGEGRGGGGVGVGGGGGGWGLIMVSVRGANTGFCKRLASVARSVGRLVIISSLCRTLQPVPVGGVTVVFRRSRQESGQPRRD